MDLSCHSWLYHQFYWFVTFLMDLSKYSSFSWNGYDYLKTIFDESMLCFRNQNFLAIFQSFIFCGLAMESSCRTWSLFYWYQIRNGLDDCKEWRWPIQFRWLRKKLFCCFDNGCLLYSCWDCILCGLHRRFCQKTKTKRAIWTSLHRWLLKINLIRISFIIIHETLYIK